MKKTSKSNFGIWIKGLRILRQLINHGSQIVYWISLIKYTTSNKQ
jgi:hypothetical protein